MQNCGTLLYIRGQTCPGRSDKPQGHGGIFTVDKKTPVLLLKPGFFFLSVLIRVFPKLFHLVLGKPLIDIGKHVLGKIELSLPTRAELYNRS